MLVHWIKKFQVALAGLYWAIRDQNSFHVHLVVAAAVLSLAAALGLSWWQWAVLVIAIGGVLTAELLNTAIELLVAVLHPQHDPKIGRVLDVAAAAVLTASAAAAIIGLLILGPEIYRWLSS